MKTVCADILVMSVLNQPLLYSIPDSISKEISRGAIVTVPFGRKSAIGIVINIRNVDIEREPFSVKPVGGCMYGWQVVQNDIISLIIWIRDYYASTLLSVLETVIPSAIRNGTREKFDTFVLRGDALTKDSCESLFKKSPKQYQLCKMLLSADRPILRSALSGFSASTINALLKKQFIKFFYENVDRSPCDTVHKFCACDKKKDIVLTNEQRAAADDILSSIRSKKFNVHLLHGVTGSGKTEVYLSNIREVVSNGGSVIYLVPELSLTPQTVARISNGLNTKNAKIVVWHSGLSDGERRDAWLAMAAGRANVVIGARSAVFSPLKNVRLVIVDEEHEVTYKQEESPRYNARDVAVYRAKLCNAVCVLGSATPSMESMYNASIGKYKINKITSRIDGSALPRFEIVDMRYERCSAGRKIISQKLSDLIDDRLKKNDQIVLFLNKRGFSSTVFCNSCDYVATCPHCSTSLTYHKSHDLLCCHLCNYVEPLPKVCKKCGSPDIFQSGVGTQKVVDVVQSMFPSARIERMDSDTMTTKNCFYKALSRFGNGEIDILVGTQMISKGLDFPNISLVGIINIDNAMNFPDFRSNERTFQSIIQVSGRAGRGEKGGTVVIQTYCASSQLIKMAINNEVEKFFDVEMASRKEFLYPPSSHIIRIIFSGHSDDQTAVFAELFCKNLQNIANKTFEIRGVSPAVIQKQNDKFRYSISCFTKSVKHALDCINATKSSIVNKSVHVVIDVDPMDMM